MLHVFKWSRNTDITFIFGHFTVYAYWTLDFFCKKNPWIFISTQETISEMKLLDISWWGQIGRGQCKLLSAVRNLRMWSWSVVEKFSLNCLLISISGKSTWTELDKGRRDGNKTSFFNFFLIFYFFMSFILISLFNTRFHSHLVSFHFFFFKKIKKINIMQFHVWPSVVFMDIRLKCGQACGKNMTKKLPSESVLERKRFGFFYLALKQKKCRYERTFKESNHLA